MKFDTTFLERIPEYLYPWGQSAYLARLDECIALYGVALTQRLCTDLILWHTLLHVLGALFLLVALEFVRRRSQAAAIILSVFYVFFFIYQELIDQPVRILQTYQKGTEDLVVWFLPLALFWLYHCFLTKRARDSV